MVCSKIGCFCIFAYNLKLDFFACMWYWIMNAFLETFEVGNRNKNSKENNEHEKPHALVTTSNPNFWGRGVKCPHQIQGLSSTWEVHFFIGLMAKMSMRSSFFGDEWYKVGIKCSPQIYHQTFYAPTPTTHKSLKLKKALSMAKFDKQGTTW